MTLSNVEVADPLPDLSAIDCGDGTNVIATMAPDAVVECTATYTVTQADIDAGGVQNTATATGTVPDQSTVSDEDDEDVPSEPQAPGLDFEKLAYEAAQKSIAIGQEVTYTFIVTNTGNVTLSDVAVIDPLPGLSPTDCGDGTNVVATLAPDAVVECTATNTITQDDVDGGQLTNTAEATGCFEEDNCVEEPDEEIIPSDPDPDISIYKEADEDAQDGIEVGPVITYTFIVTNTGNVTLADVEVTDDLPGLSEIDCDGTNQIESLAPDEEVECTATYTVTDDDAEEGEITNCATVTGCFLDECVGDEDSVTVPGPEPTPTPTPTRTP